MLVSLSEGGNQMARDKAYSVHLGWWDEARYTGENEELLVQTRRQIIRQIPKIANYSGQLSIRNIDLEEATAAVQEVRTIVREWWGKEPEQLLEPVQCRYFGLILSIPLVCTRCGRRCDDTYPYCKPCGNHMHPTEVKIAEL